MPYPLGLIIYMIFIVILKLITLYLLPCTVGVNAHTFQCEITVNFISVHLDMHFDVYISNYVWLNTFFIHSSPNEEPRKLLTKLNQITSQNHQMTTGKSHDSNKTTFETK